MNIDLTDALTRIKNNYEQFPDELLLRTYIKPGKNAYKIEVNRSGDFFYVHISGNDRYQEIPWIIDEESSSDNTDIMFLTNQISKYIKHFDE